MVRLSSNNRANNSTPDSKGGGNKAEADGAATTAAASSPRPAGGGVENTPPSPEERPGGAGPASPAAHGTSVELAPSEESPASIAGKTGWAAHPNQICKMGRAKKFRLLLARFLDLERPLVTTRMLAFLRQDGCLPELMRFIVNPELAVSDAAAEDTHNIAVDRDDGPGGSKGPDLVRRAFRSLKMLVDDERIHSMLQQNLSGFVPVLFEVFDVLERMQAAAGGSADWAPPRSSPSLYHWAALVNSLLNSCMEDFVAVRSRPGGARSRSKGSMLSHPRVCRPWRRADFLASSSAGYTSSLSTSHLCTLVRPAKLSAPSIYPSI